MPKWSYASITGQQEQRRPETFADQHGREYGAEVEITTGDPCSTLVPLGWTAPTGPDWFRGLLMPPDHLRQMVPRHERGKRRYHIHINYTQWLAEHDERDDAWQRRLEDLAQRATKGVDFVSMVENPPTAMLDYMGPKAFPPRVFIEAMAAGDPWSLGQSDRIPKKAILLLDEIEFQVKRSRARRRRPESEIVNPFADEDEDSGEVTTTEDYEAVTVNPFGSGDEGAEGDALDDLDEIFDPKASGGKTERVRRSRTPRV